MSDTKSVCRGERSAQTDCSDLRSPLAKARDDWMFSDDGAKATDSGILFSSSYAQYLRNRIESAWLAGAGWGMDHPNASGQQRLAETRKDN